MKMMDKEIGIVYYSKDGSTRLLAQLLREKHGGKIIELGLNGFFRGERYFLPLSLSKN